MSDTMLSILTLYTWDNTIFDNMVIPPELDREILIDNLLMENAEFEVLYSDPDFMKIALGVWSKKELKKWQEKYDTTVLDYNPIENYNRTETGSETESRDLNGTDNQTRDLASTGNDTTTVDSEINRSGDDTMVKSTNAYDATTVFTDSEKDVATQATKEENDSTVTTGTTGTESGTVNNSTTDTGTVTNSRDLNMKGNIGVTTTQQMIQQERDIVEFNIYDYIIESYKMKFSITIY
jgi:hypothetical protein